MGRIQKLPETTIRLIAAGEVITSPVNVVKELLENSLDAGSTNIRIIIEAGGTERIEILDNGCGIAQADAELLCTRHATSKINSAVDLLKISTFGFRGEALASISEMADVEVFSFNKNEDIKGWNAKYEGGQLVEPIKSKFSQTVGTHIIITKLFACYSSRQSASKANASEEKKAIVNLVTKFAIHHREIVTISIKEDSPNKSQELLCLLAPMTIQSCFGMFFGLEMENNLVKMRADLLDTLKTEVEVVFSYKKSSVSYMQNNFILFINDRLVEWSHLKKDLETLANQYVNAKQHVLLFYISITLPYSNVDVNKHPTKSQVALHYETEISSAIVESLRAKLEENLATQTISSKAILPFPINNDQLKNSQTTSSLKRPHHNVHNDSSQRSLKQFITADKLMIDNCQRRNMNEEYENSSSPPLIPPQRYRRDLKLRSISELRQLVAGEKCGEESEQTIKNSVFVGIFDHDRALIQHETKLYAINLRAYLKEQYYQFFLYDFGNFPPIEILPPGNKINFILDTYLEDIRKHEFAKYEKLKFNTSEAVVEELLTHSKMYKDYLSLNITSTEVITLPCIMPDEIPNLIYLGRFLSDLVNHVDYTEERECFKQIGRYLAIFYSEPPANLKDVDVHRRYHDLVESKLYVAIKNYLFIPEWLFTRENICQISDTKDLYKVFERC